MQTVRVRLADMSFRKTNGPSFRDEQQLKMLVKNNTRSNGHVQWADLQFEQDDEEDAELSEDNQEEEVLLLSEDDFSDDTIDISPDFDGFDRALGRNVIGCCEKEHMMLAYMLDDLVKGI